MKISIQIVLLASLFLVSCSGTKTVLRYQRLTQNDFKDGQVFEAEAHPFQLLTKFKIIVGVINDSIHVAIYGGGLHRKDGIHTFKESDGISSIRIHTPQGELTEVKGNIYASTKNTLIFKNENKLYIRFNVAGYNQEYQTEIRPSKADFASAFQKYEDWKKLNEIKE